MVQRVGSTSSVRPIEHLSLVDRVTDELRRAILVGDMPPGSTVSIVELCEQFDVSHIPVREALRRLEIEGTVTLRPGRSALVAPLSVQDLTDIYRLRRIIEGDLVERAVKGMSDDRVAEAERALEDYIAIGSEPAALAAAHHHFHAVFLEDVMGATDRRLLNLLWHTADRYLHLMMRDLDVAPESRDQRIAEHRAILDLARARKGSQTRKAWVAHLDASEAALRAGLEPLSAVPEA